MARSIKHTSHVLIKASLLGMMFWAIPIREDKSKKNNLMLSVFLVTITSNCRLFSTISSSKTTVLAFSYANTLILPLFSNFQLFKYLCTGTTLQTFFFFLRNITCDHLVIRGMWVTPSLQPSKEENYKMGQYNQTSIYIFLCISVFNQYYCLGIILHYLLNDLLRCG